uniref:Nuclear prelamin A recognition factor isoform X2 n=1 Tax=Sus scrofa TaxID=9823 RepID=A0A480TZK7_PIG
MQPNASPPAGVHYVFDATIAADFSILESQKEFVRRFHQHSEEEPALPMLTSACPGWVRYAERVLGHPVTPHLCTARSPQQIMGSLVKDYFARRQDLSADRIFHVIVAPCYDRKLEALQEDVPTASPGFRGTDCVLTSGEGGASGGTARGAASPSQHPVCVPSEGLAAGDKGTVCTCQGRCGWFPGGPCPWAGGESQQPLGAAGVPWDLKTHLVLPSVKR